MVIASDILVVSVCSATIKWEEKLSDTVAELANGFCVVKACVSVNDRAFDLLPTVSFVNAFTSVKSSSVNVSLIARLNVITLEKASFTARESVFKGSAVSKAMSDKVAASAAGILKS